MIYFPRDGKHDRLYEVVHRTVFREQNARAIMHTNNNNNNNNTRHVSVRALGTKPAKITAARRAREADPLPRIHRSTRDPFAGCTRFPAHGRVCYRHLVTDTFLRSLASAGRTR